jgi:hypothetical protein
VGGFLLAGNMITVPKTHAYTVTASLETGANVTGAYNLLLYVEDGTRSSVVDTIELIRQMDTPDTAYAGAATVQLAAGEKVYLVLEETATGDFEVAYASLSLEELDAVPVHLRAAQYSQPQLRRQQRRR